MVTTCMNIKVGNSKVVAGDYATYEGMRIGLLQSQTYNDGFLQWADEKGFAYTVTYYDTLADLTNALREDKVDAIVDSYIRTPEDELTIEDFGQTAYYILARKEDQGLIDALDAAFDAMNIDNPNWRVELYNKYHGAAGHNTKFTAEESALLAQMQQSGTTVRAAAAPDNAPYSWYADGKMQGIAVDLAQKTAEALGLTLEVVPTATYKDYNALLQSGEADLCLDLDSDEITYGDTAYQLTDTYMRTTVSLLRQRGAYEHVHCLVVMEDSATVREFIAANWPEAEVTVLDSTGACAEAVENGTADAALLKSYTAQKLARDDIQNRMRVDIVPGALVYLRNGVNVQVDRRFYSLWEKTMNGISTQYAAEIVQSYTEVMATPTVLAFLFGHPRLPDPVCGGAGAGGLPGAAVSAVCPQQKTAAGDLAAAGRRFERCRRSQQGQAGILLQDEPRHPHAAECGAGHDPDRPEIQERCPAAGKRTGQHYQRGQLPAGAHQLDSGREPAGARPHGAEQGSL